MGPSHIWPRQLFTTEAIPEGVYQWQLFAEYIPSSRASRASLKGSLDGDSPCLPQSTLMALSRSAAKRMVSDVCQLRVSFRIALSQIKAPWWNSHFLPGKSSHPKTGCIEGRDGHNNLVLQPQSVHCKTLSQEQSSPGIVWGLCCDYITD